MWNSWSFQTFDPKVASVHTQANYYHHLLASFTAIKTKVQNRLFFSAINCSWHFQTFFVYFPTFPWPMSHSLLFPRFPCNQSTQRYFLSLSIGYWITWHQMWAPLLDSTTSLILPMPMMLPSSCLTWHRRLVLFSHLTPSHLGSQNIMG